MKVVCAWCSKEISASRGDDGLVSHGICVPCSHDFLGESWVSIKESVKGLQFPVMLLDREMRVEVVSGSAVTMLGTSAKYDSKLLAGVVIGCVNSQLPGGCGHSVRCGGCVLRATATATFADGKSRNGVSTAHHLKTNGGVREVQIVFSAERLDVGVMLYIEEVCDRTALALA